MIAILSLSFSPPTLLTCLPLSGANVQRFDSHSFWQFGEVASHGSWARLSGEGRGRTNGYSLPLPPLSFSLSSLFFSALSLLIPVFHYHYFLSLFHSQPLILIRPKGVEERRRGSGHSRARLNCSLSRPRGENSTHWLRFRSLYRRTSACFAEALTFSFFFTFSFTFSFTHTHANTQT